MATWEQIRADSERRKERIIDMHDKGLRVAAIAEVEGVSRQYVHRILAAS